MKKPFERLNRAEVKRRLKAIPKWSVQKKALVRRQEFPTYLRALAFVGRLGRRAEREDHHPDTTLKYKTVIIRFSTYSANGITTRDFEMALRADQLMSGL